MLIRVEDRGWPEFDSSAVDGDFPPLEVYLLVMGRAEWAAV
jgi:hypothetical protein